MSIPASSGGSSARNSMASNGSAARLSNARPTAKPKDKAPRKDILASLKKTTMEASSKPFLPAGMINGIYYLCWFREHHTDMRTV